MKWMVIKRSPRTKNAVLVNIQAHICVLNFVESVFHDFLATIVIFGYQVYIHANIAAHIWESSYCVQCPTEGFFSYLINIFINIKFGH